MKIKWLGHSCFLLTSASGATLLTDPYDTSAYPGALLHRPLDDPPGIAPDVVTVSHGHADHGNVEALSGTPEIVKTPRERLAAGFSIRGVESFHDTEHGALRGENLIFLIRCEGMTVCHLGDLGHELEPAQLEAVGEVDVLLIPVGGVYTVDAAAATRVWRQLSPRVAIPMHYRNEKCLFKIDGVDKFTSGKQGVEYPGNSEIDLSKDNLPGIPKIFVLEPEN
ncbi:MAG: MBL fold metallo-hydrolase [Thermoleophilia bacterium]|nr:MBL fold metallo-hydrolase [Thermoleophilia bacterium]